MYGNQAIPQPAGTDAATKVPANDPAASGQPTEFITPAALQEATAKIDRDMKAALGRLGKTIEGLQGLLQPKGGDAAPGNAQPGDAEPPSVSAARTQLKQQETELAKQRESIQLAAVRTSITAQLQEAGANPALLGLAVDGLIARNRGKLSVETGEFGEQTIHVKNGAETFALKDFIGNYLQGEGKAILMPKQTPQMPGSQGGVSGSKTQVKMADVIAGRVSREDLKSGRIEIVD